METVHRFTQMLFVISLICLCSVIYIKYDKEAAITKQPKVIHGKVKSVVYKELVLETSAKEVIMIKLCSSGKWPLTKSYMEVPLSLTLTKREFLGDPCFNIEKIVLD